jgi:hypothetical protein
LHLLVITTRVNLELPPKECRESTLLRPQVSFFFFFFFFLGPVCISSGSTAAFKAYCAYKFPSKSLSNISVILTFGAIESTLLRASLNKPQNKNANHRRIRQSVYTTHSQFSVFSRVFKLFNPTPVARRHVYLASAVTAPQCPPLPRNCKGLFKKVNLFTRPSAAVRKVGFTKLVGSKTVQYLKNANKFSYFERNSIPRRSDRGHRSRYRAKQTPNFVYFEVTILPI